MEFKNSKSRKAELKTEYVKFKLFPSVSLCNRDIAIRANFGEEELRFTKFNNVLEYLENKGKIYLKKDE